MVDRVLELKQRLESRDAAIQSFYKTIIEEMGLVVEPTYAWAYYDIAPPRRKHWWEKTTDDADEHRREMTVTVNRLHQIIEAQRTVLGSNRSLRVPPPDPSDAAAAYAAKLENAIRHLWREWVMPRQLSLMGWYAAIFGCAVGVVFWSESKRIPFLRIEGPIGFYPVSKMDDAAELGEALFVRHVDGLTLSAQYPSLRERYGSRDDIEVIDYYGPDKYVRVIAGEERPLEQADNSLGRVPVFVFPGILGPGALGLSPMSLAIPIHRELQRLYSLEAEVLTAAVRAPTVINDPISVPEGWAWGDDAVIEVGPQGRVGKAPLENIDHNLFFHRIEDMKRALDDVMDFASMSRGEFEGSILTGKGVNSLLRPNSLRLEGRLQAIDPIIERVNEVALLLWHTLGRNIDVTIYGRDSGSNPFTMRFNPKTDIDPDWVRNFVWLDTSSLFDRQSNIAQILTALRAGTPSQQAISQQKAIELLPFADDAEAERRRIWEEWKRANEFMQAQAQPPAPGSPTAEEEMAAAERGGNPEGAQVAGETGQPAAPPEETGGTAMPEGQGGDKELLVAVADFMRSIANIKGRVYLCGEILDGVIDYGIEIYITEPLDKQTIINAFRNDEQLAPLAEDRQLHFRETPAGRMLEVTPGTQGYEPEEVSEVAEPEPVGR